MEKLRNQAESKVYINVSKEKKKKKNANKVEKK